MRCKLCSQEKKLVNSHIIPEFAFRPLYDAKHRFHKVVSDIAERNSLLQKGVRERLLCEDCEGLFSKHEKYVSDVFSGKQEILLSNVNGLVSAERMDYRSFKLFALSVLWRAGVSSIPFFHSVSLGVHEERLRKMLIANNPGRSSDYPFALTLILHEKQLMSALIMEPEATRLGGHIAYRFVFSGLVWIFVVSSHSTPSVMKDVAINEAGQFKLLPRNISDLPFITEQAVLLSSMGKLES